ncbi:MAG: response regulator transcription factor [Ignavibacteriae bacterium]|nr:response regulator transcription factor [Ignavibacteriota bacterium]
MKKNLLLVDDHSVVRDGLRMVLGSSPDYEVIAEAENGEEAVRTADSHRPDIIIMDISMPKLNGLEATALIKRKHPEIKIIILSVHANEEYISQARRVGADGYVLKSSRKSELLNALDHALMDDSFYCAQPA